MHPHQISWFVFLNILSWKPQFVRRRSWPGLKFLHWRFLSFILLPSNHNSSHDWNDHQLIIFDKGFITSLISNDFQETNGHQRGKLTRLRKKYCALLDMWVIHYLFRNLKSFNIARLQSLVTFERFNMCILLMSLHWGSCGKRQIANRALVRPVFWVFIQFVVS